MRISLPRKNINIVKVIDLVDQGIQAKKPKSHYEIIFTDDEKAIKFLEYCVVRLTEIKREIKPGIHIIQAETKEEFERIKANLRGERVRDMADKQEKLVIILSESVVSSLVKDTFTFAMFAGLLYFNHQYLSGNGWIDFLFIVIVILILISKKSKYAFTGNKKDAIEWLTK